MPRPPQPRSLAGRAPAAATRRLPFCVSVSERPPFRKDAHGIGGGLVRVTLFNLHDLCEDLASEQGRVARLGLPQTSGGTRVNAERPCSHRHAHSAQQ